MNKTCARPQKILVTGAAGFIGSHTVDHLLELGHEVYGVDNLRTGSVANLSNAIEYSNFTFSELDLLDKDSFCRKVDEFKPNAIIHLAALVSVPESISNPDLNFNLNVETTHIVTEAVRRYGISRIVFASSAAVYGADSETALIENATCSPISPYGAAKYASENLLLGYGRTFGSTVRVQRYFNVYGPRQDPTSPYSGVLSIFSQNALAQKPLIINGDGCQTRDFIYVEDVARANALAAISGGVKSGVANICTGVSSSINDVIDVVGKQVAWALKTENISPRGGDIRHSLGNPRKAERDLNFRNRIELAVGLKRYIGYVRQNRDFKTTV